MKATRTSAPGLYGIGYDIIHKFRTALIPALVAGLQFSWRHSRSLATRNTGAMKRLYKRGNHHPTTELPICLQNGVFKIYASILSKRLARWKSANDRFCLSQIGFHDIDGCHEHNFVSSMLIDHARRNRDSLCIVWYDLRNAFGSVPTDLIWQTMTAIGVPGMFIDRWRDIYHNSFNAIINAADGQSDPIRHQVGVYHGRP
ncbi:TPA: hypothetical protein N0F65_006052 [Lagenidium giganteum]|uniref:Reverse transcriptase domain-containing protein n=1 Tax=Lagenidium giganteum TaxID=4803 RepID=A0AAV2YL50_9STRA|nr:TPA: hypothetical protein N0F65_006052 [Lagenidium giganteum]